MFAFAEENQTETSTAPGAITARKAALLTLSHTHTFTLTGINTSHYLEIT